METRQPAPLPRGYPLVLHYTIVALALEILDWLASVRFVRKDLTSLAEETDRS